MAKTTHPAKTESPPDEAGEIPAVTRRQKCGIVMPISTCDGCPPEHWADVLAIIQDALDTADLDSELVSQADNAGVIHKRIVQNLYERPIVVCDVSGKNPNVMFELGMRLAFDKPTVIVKDDCTDYSFDTSVIEHLTYPRDLRFARIIDFKNRLTTMIQGTLKASRENPQYSTFLKHFGKFTIAKLDTEEVSKEDFILQELRELRADLSRDVVKEAYLRSRKIGLISGTREIPKTITTYKESDKKIKHYVERSLSALTQIAPANFSRVEVDEVTVDAMTNSVMNDDSVRKFGLSREAIKSLVIVALWERHQIRLMS